MVVSRQAGLRRGRESAGHCHRKPTGTALLLDSALTSGMGHIAILSWSVQNLRCRVCVEVVVDGQNLKDMSIWIFEIYPSTAIFAVDFLVIGVSNH